MRSATVSEPQGALGAEARAIRAKQIMEDPLVAEAFQSLRDATVTAFWAPGHGNTPEVRERVWLMGQLVDRLESHFKTILATGALEASLVETQQKDTLMARLFGGRS